MLRYQNSIDVVLLNAIGLQRVLFLLVCACEGKFASPSGCRAESNTSPASTKPPFAVRRVYRHDRRQTILFKMTESRQFLGNTVGDHARIIQGNITNVTNNFDAGKAPGYPLQRWLY